MNPSQEDVKWHIAETYYKISIDTDDSDEAIGYCKKAIEFEPRFAEAYFNMGWLYSFRGCYGEAVKCWEKAIELNPGYAEDLEFQLAKAKEIHNQ